MQLHQNIGRRAIAVGDRTIEVAPLDDPKHLAAIQKTLADVSPVSVSALKQSSRATVALDDALKGDVKFDLVTVENSQIAKILERSPGGLVRFSRVGFDRAGQAAIVFVTHVCGGLCGTGHYIVLEKNAVWRITAVHMVFISLPEFGRVSRATRRFRRAQRAGCVPLNVNFCARKPAWTSAPWAFFTVGPAASATKMLPDGSTERLCGRPS